jgi:hypothetical protein
MTPLLIPGFTHHLLLADPISVQLFLGGLLGGFLRALFGRGKTWERILVLHVFSGAFFAVLVPNAYKYWAGSELTGSALFWMSAGVFIGLFGNFIVVAALWRLGVFKDDPRASTPENGSLSIGDGPPPSTGGQQTP